MDYLQLIIKFGSVLLAALFFGMRNGAPKKTLIASPALGMLGYIIYWYLEDVSEVAAFFLGTFVCCLLSEVFARILRTPTTVLSFVAIIPIVPGVMLYNTMLEFTNKNISGGIEMAIRTLAAAGCMAFAITIASLCGKHIISPIFNIIDQKRASKKKV